VIPYNLIKEIDQAVYAIRPFIHSNLYDRMSTRPFLTDLEQKWIVYQILIGLSHCHKLSVNSINQIYHGDLKSENILVTSWNWVLISDFASFKPVFLPEVISFKIG
jgi:phosphoinositide-3-kinase regulatory subunit 4